MLDLLTGTVDLPNQSLSEKEIKEKYGSIKTYELLTARYWAKYWNSNSLATFNKTTQTSNWNEQQDIYENFSFFHGFQSNTEFSYLEQVLDGQNFADIATPFLPGQDIRAIILFLMGQFLQIVKNANPEVSVINEDIRSKVTQEVKLINITKKFEAYLKKATEASGMEMVNQINPNQSQEDIIKQAYSRFSTELSKHAMRILQHVQQNSMQPFDYLRAFTNAIVGRRAVLEVTDDGLIENSEPQFFKDVSIKDDDFGRYSIARMKFYAMHKDDIIREYGKNLTFEEKEQIKSGSFATNNLELWNKFSGNYAYPLMTDKSLYTCFDVYFLTNLDSRLEIVKDEDGDLKIKRIRKESKKGEMVQVLKKVTIAANLFVLDSEIVTTVTRREQRGNQIFPIVFFQPHTYMGVNQSLVDQLKNVAKEIDAINFKIREFYTTDIGTIIVMNGKKFKDGISPTEIYNELKRTRITVSTSSGESDDPTNREPLIQVENASLMREIQNYISLVENKRQLLMSYANINPMVMGTPSQYVASKTQANSAQLSSNSVVTYFDGIFTLFEDAAIQAIERVKKRIQKNPEDSYWQNLLGDEGVDWILSIKNEPFSSFHASIKRKDIIDQQKQMRINQMMDNLAATGQVDFEDVIMTMDMESVSQLKDYARYSVKKKQAMQTMAAMMEQGAREQDTQIMANASVEGKVAAEEIKNERSGKQNVTSFINNLVKQGVPPEQIAQMMQGGGGEGQPQGSPMPQEGSPMPQQGSPMPPQ